MRAVEGSPLAELAGDILHDVASDDILDTLGREATLEHQPLLAVDRAGGAELGQQVGEAVLRLAVPGGKTRLSARWFSAILSRYLSPS